MNEEMINLVFKMVFAVASVLITGYLLPWIRSKMDNEKYSELLIFIQKCVEAAEKVYTPEEWKEKKKYVIDAAEHKLDSLGINITAEELDILVEGFVKVVKG